MFEYNAISENLKAINCEFCIFRRKAIKSKVN